MITAADIHASLGGRRNGAGFKVFCPAHNDGRNPSLSVTDGPDGKILLTCREGCTNDKVVARLKELRLWEGTGRARSGAIDKMSSSPRKPRPVGPRILMPVPEDAPAPPEMYRFESGRTGKPARQWTYKGSRGETLFHIGRFNHTKDGVPDKWFTPLSYVDMPDGKREWITKLPIEKGRVPLYGLDKLAARPGAPFLLLEGEKCADAAEPMFPGFVTISFHGGKNRVAYADWSPLAGRRGVAFPDADADGKGIQAMREAAQLIAVAGAIECLIVELPQGLPDKWDVADPAPPGIDVQVLVSNASPSLITPSQIFPKEETTYVAERRAAELEAMAGRMRLAEAEEGEVLEALLARNRARCRPPLSEAQVMAIAADRPADYEPARETPERKLWTAKDLLALPPRDVHWIVKGILSEGLAVLSAAPKKGKSFLALDMACHVASGRNFLGHDVVQQPVLYCDWEQDEHIARRRLSQVGWPDGPGNLAQFYFPPSDDILNDAGMAWLDDQVQTKGFGIVIIDIMESAIDRSSSNRIHNSYVNDSAVFRRYQAWAKERRVCLLFVHHTNKGEASVRGADKQSGSRGLRGAAYTSWTLSEKSEADDGRSFEYELEIEGKLVTSCTLALEKRFTTGGGLSWKNLGEASQYFMQATRRTIRDYLVSNPMSSPATIARGTDLRPNTVKGTLRRMESDGQVIGIGGKYHVKSASRDLSSLRNFTEPRERDDDQLFERFDNIMGGDPNVGQ